MTVIIDSSQVALQVHESCGHPIELDRVLGMEASFAGTSFLTLDKLDRLQYGSPLVNIDADATAPGGLGTFAYDDEGVPAQNVPIVSAGRFVGYLTSRETAPDHRPSQHGQRSRLGLERHPADPDDERQPAARRGGQPRRSDRRHRATGSTCRRIGPGRSTTVA